jgi:glycosyltransferase involved in cell wall biosynthesis
VTNNKLSVSRVSVVISVYKDIDALALILHALNRQTVLGFEILVSEDGEDPMVKDFIDNTETVVVHVNGADVGWTKNQALNRASCKASGDYLIFIDGDCIPHRCFVENHIKLSETSVVLSGRRVDVGEGYAMKLKRQEVSIGDFEKLFWLVFNLPALIKDKSRALEDGIYFSPRSWLHRNVFRRISKIRGILGCNFSCWKEDLFAINGFDEDYSSPAVGEDTDLEWRFHKIGVAVKSCRNMAIVYHFRHPLRFDGFEGNLELMRLKIMAGKAFCDNGIIKK